MEWLGGRIDKQAVEQVTGLKIITPLIGHIPQGLDDLLIPALGHFQLAELTQGELAKVIGEERRGLCKQWVTRWTYLFRRMIVPMRFGHQLS